MIYVGKAKSLRSRLNSYFADISGLAPRTRQMVTTAGSVEWTVVSTEVEALQLEYNWIKEFDPRFNIRYRDDKSYPVLAVTLNEEYPRLMVYRGPRRKGVRYFGPYSHAWAIRETLDLLTRVFPARTCSAGVFKRHNQIGRPCLLGYIDKCSAPCVGRVSAEEHRQIVQDFCDFLAGKTDRLVRDMEQQMNAAAEELDFERAARLRDNIGALKRALEKQTVVFGDGTDADVVAFADDELEAAVQVFHVRGGRVRGQRGWVVEKSGEPGESGQEQLVEQFLTQFYGDQAELGGAGRRGDQPGAAAGAGPGAARTTPTSWRSWLSRAARIAGVSCGCRSAATSARSPRPCTATPRMRWRSTSSSAPATSTRDRLRCRAFRSASVSPTRRCASSASTSATCRAPTWWRRWWCSRTGCPRKSDYRHYAIREAAGDGRSDDVASIAEVTRRRFHRHLARRRASDRLVAGRASRASSPIRRTCSSSTAAPRRSTPPRRCSTNSASPTSR